MPRVKTLAPEYAFRDLGKAIRCGLVNKDLTQAELADRLGVTDTTVGRWIAHPERLNIGQLRKLVEVLGIEIVPVMKAIGYRERSVKEVAE